ncbi:MAG: hypothetical protein QG577_297 [Thermodesulfobacteriota bacterium]|jgi:hypothetical protein|nr:hypothetical protein [Thermodesulfobacteriota bacterium]
MEEKKETWLNYLALITVIIALGATLSTLRVGSFSSGSILKQTQASNQWSYFQAKSIKSSLYEIQKEELEFELNTIGQTASRDVTEKLEKKIASYSQRIKRYDDEKAAIMSDAKKLEAERDLGTRHSQAFGLAVILLQLAILLSSIAALMKNKSVWVLGLLLGGLGIVAFANGYWLFL